MAYCWLYWNSQLDHLLTVVLSALLRIRKSVSPDPIRRALLRSGEPKRRH